MLRSDEKQVVECERDGQTRSVTCGWGDNSRLTRARKVGSRLCTVRAARLRVASLGQSETAGW